MEAIALADDTTGALEIGAQFARDHVTALVTTQTAPEWSSFPPTAAGLVIDTDTRHMGSIAAHERIRALAAESRRGAIPYIYKKTDSTLRGNIAGEFQALLDVYPDRALVYAPAYPALGRVVAGGLLYVDGRPLAETAFSGDPLNPSSENSIPNLLARGCTAPVRLARTSKELSDMLGGDVFGSILVCDGRGESDLAAVAGVLKRCGKPHIAAGPGGFAAHWVNSLPIARRASTCRMSARRCLVLNGSLHPVSREQTRLGGLSRIPVFHPGAVSAATLSRVIATQGWAILTTSQPAADEPATVARRMGESAREAMDCGEIEGLVIFGGDTAFAVLAMLGCTVVQPCGELLPGIPLSRFRYHGKEIALVTKAGGFGAADVIRLIRESLEKEEK